MSSARNYYVGLYVSSASYKCNCKIRIVESRLMYVHWLLVLFKYAVSIAELLYCRMRQQDYLRVMNSKCRKGSGVGVPQILYHY
jgi:hypothetical protein